MTLYTDFYKLKCVEPIKRKHGSILPEWQIHRFPIKHGITLRDAMIYDMLYQPNLFIMEDDMGLSFRGILVRLR